MKSWTSKLKKGTLEQLTNKIKAEAKEYKVMITYSYHYLKQRMIDRKCYNRGGKNLFITMKS
jgi:hypothetical protein